MSHVFVVEPLKQEDKDIQVKVFVALPDGKDIREDNYVAIAGSVLKEILEAYKQNLSSAVGAEVKSINTESDSSDNVTDNTMNYIMIPITFALLIVLCCVAFCLHSARYINALSLIVLILLFLCYHADILLARHAVFYGKETRDEAQRTSACEATSKKNLCVLTTGSSINSRPREHDQGCRFKTPRLCFQPSPTAAVQNSILLAD